MSLATYETFNVALITGAGGGLGKAMAHNFIKHGKKVIIAGRTEANLKEAKNDLGANCLAYYVAELDRIEGLSAFVDKALAEHPEIDALVNNAGISGAIDFAKGDLSPADIDAQITTNITSVLNLCSLFSKHLQSKSTSALMNVTSGLAYIPVSFWPIYCAIKAFIASFTRSLRVQLKSTSVRVVEICPPLTDSDLMRHAENKETFSSKNNPHAITQEQFIKEIEEGLLTDASAVAAGSARDRLQIWENGFGAYWRRVNQI